ncbi:MAG: GTP cyclohydrolase I type 1, partial [uncultured Frankineae bacterium]
AALRRPARRGGGPRAAGCGGRGRRPPGAARDAGPGRADVRRGLLRAARRPRRAGAAGLRRAPRRADHRARHPAVELLRAPPDPVDRHGRRRLPAGQGRPDHRAEQAGPAGRPLRQAALGAGAADLAGRRRAGRAPRAAGRDRGGRGRAHVHDRARRAQAGRPHGDLGRARGAQDQRGHPVRGHEPDPGPL